MNNEHKGEVSFEAGGTSYVMRRSWNSICELEGLTGQGFVSLMTEFTSWGPPLDAKGKPKKETAAEQEARISKIRGTTLRAVFCSMLRDQRPDFTLRQAGDLLDELGVPRVFELITLASDRGSSPEMKGGNPTAKPNGLSPSVSTPN